jgi:hypothetical protein
MSTSAYQEVLNLVKQLTIDKQLRLLEELTAMVHHQSTTEPEHNIMEFKGIAKGTWAGVDVQAYINQERDSW